MLTQIVHAIQKKLRDLGEEVSDLDDDDDEEDEDGEDVQDSEVDGDGTSAKGEESGTGK